MYVSCSRAKGITCVFVIRIIRAVSRQIMIGYLRLRLRLTVSLSKELRMRRRRAVSLKVVSLVGVEAISALSDVAAERLSLAAKEGRGGRGQAPVAAPRVLRVRSEMKVMGSSRGSGEEVEALPGGVEEGSSGAPDDGNGGFFALRAATALQGGGRSVLAALEPRSAHHEHHRLEVAFGLEVRGLCLAKDRDQVLRDPLERFVGNGLRELGTDLGTAARMLLFAPPHLATVCGGRLKDATEHPVLRRRRGTRLPHHLENDIQKEQSNEMKIRFLNHFPIPM
jgi:hypothetical protein